MKAVVYDKSDPSGVLVYREVEKPAPGDGEVLVKIYNVGINAADYRSIKMGIIPKNKIFGADIAGCVEAVGKNVKKFRIGDEVLGDIAGCGFGGFAEYAAVPETFLIAKPAGISFETAAAVPMASVTALQALRKGDVQPGQKVLIVGAGGGVGTFAVQLAGYFGAEVSAVCSGKNAEFVKSLGAKRIIDYTKSDFAVEGGPYDLILAVNGKNPLHTYKKALTPKGACIFIGGALSQIIKGMIHGLLPSMGGKKVKLLSAKPNSEDLSFIIGLVEEGRIRPVIDRRYPLREASEAMGYLSAGHAQGKVVLEVVSETIPQAASAFVPEVGVS